MYSGVIELFTCWQLFTQQATVLSNPSAEVKAQSVNGTPILHNCP